MALNVIKLRNDSIALLADKRILRRASLSKLYWTILTDYERIRYVTQQRIQLEFISFAQSMTRFS